MHEGLAKRVIAANEEFVSSVKSFEIFDYGYPGRFAVFAAVAVFAGEDQVPDTVKINFRNVPLQGVWEKMVDIAEGTAAGKIGL